MADNEAQFKRRPHGSYVQTEVMCPECRTDRILKWRKGVKRFKAKTYRCDHCGFLGRRGEWDAFDIDEWLDQ